MDALLYQFRSTFNTVCGNLLHHKPSITIVDLPTEILIQIGWLLSKKGKDAELTSLAGTCSRIRSALFTSLFESLAVYSPDRLASLATAPQSILAHTRQLSIHLDLDFYETWVWSLDHRISASTPPEPAHHHRRYEVDIFASLPFTEQVRRPSRINGSLDVLDGLVGLLSKVSGGIRTLSFVLKDLDEGVPAGGSWSPFPRPGGAGIPFATPIIQKSSTTGTGTSLLTFPHLHTLHLDGTPDIAPILRVAPKIRGIRLRSPGGFNARDSTKIVNALEFASNVRSLEVWLAPSDDVSRTDTIAQIREYLPELEWLELHPGIGRLQVKEEGKKTSWPSSGSLVLNLCSALVNVRR